MGSFTDESLQACMAHVLSAHIAQANYLKFLSSEKNNNTIRVQTQCFYALIKRSNIV